MRIGSRSGHLVLASTLMLAPVLALADKTLTKPSTGAKPKPIATKPLAGLAVRRAEPAKIQGPVYLHGFREGTELVVANNTGVKIPSGTTIYWSIKHRIPSNPNSWTETKGSFLVPQGLTLGGERYLDWPIPPVNGPYTIKAWYLPWTVPK